MGEECNYLISGVVRWAHMHGIPSGGILPAKNCATIEALKNAVLDTDSTPLKGFISLLRVFKDISKFVYEFHGPESSHNKNIHGGKYLKIQKISAACGGGNH